MANTVDVVFDVALRCGVTAIMACARNSPTKIEPKAIWEGNDTCFHRTHRAIERHMVFSPLMQSQKINCTPLHRRSMMMKNGCKAVITLRRDAIFLAL